MDNSVERRIVTHLAERGEEVIDVDPAHPLITTADATAEAEPGEVRESLESGRTLVEHDASTKHDLAAGACAARGFLPWPGDTGHLRWPVRNGVSPHNALAGIAVDRERAHLHPQLWWYCYAFGRLDERPRGLDA